MKLLFTKTFSLLFTAIFILLSAGNDAEPHDVKRPGDIRLNAVVISDTHIETNNFGRLEAFCGVLKDAANTLTPNDAVVFLGDNTMNGQYTENALFYGCVRNALGDTDVLVAAGNHDYSNGERAFAPYERRFINFNNTFLGTKLTKPYYYRVINDCYFIVLSSEDSLSHEMYLSVEQLDWFAEVMEEAGGSGKPIFVCAHHAYSSLSARTEGTLCDIMGNYKNVFYLYGHTHASFSERSFRDTPYGFRTVNLPRATELSGERDRDAYDGTGHAARLEVYDDEVVFRARNFYSGEWLEYEKAWAIE